MRLTRPFMRLPFQFDAQRLDEALHDLGDGRWMRHPSRMQGNSAIPPISSGGGDNDSFEGEKQPTPHLERCRCKQQVMASFGEVLSRSRLVREAGSSDPATSAATAGYVAYGLGKSTELPLERFTGLPVMAAGERTALVEYHREQQ